jgi:hypothetical protein
MTMATATKETAKTEAAPAAAEVNTIQTHTYPDGSSRTGCPPWPKQSPLQEEQEAKRKQAEAMGEGTKIPAGE